MLKDNALASIELRNLIEWKDNPRRTHDAEKHAELVASIRSRGLLQPLLVRPVGEASYEVIAGNRRRRALMEPDDTGAVDLDQLVPCLVRELTDEDAIAAALKENGDRDSLPPLEEADAYARLMASAGSIDEVAAMVGRSATHVRQRLRLQRLVPLARRLVAEGHLSLAAAVRLAQVESPAEQVEVLADAGVDVGLLVTEKDWQRRHEVVAALTEFDDDTWACVIEQSDHPGPRAIEHAIESTGRSFKRARFNILDADLGTVPCTECPRRTAAQGSLFSTMGDNDACLDAACWAAKHRALDERAIVAAKAAGKLYTQEDTKGWWNKHGAQLTDDWIEVHEGGPTSRTINDDERSHIITAIDQKGALHQMLPKATHDAMRARILAENVPEDRIEEEDHGDDDEQAKRAEMQAEARRKQAERAAERDREEAEFRDVQTAVLTAWAGASKEQWAQVLLLAVGASFTGRIPLRRALSLKVDDDLDRVVAHLRVHGPDTLERMAYRMLFEASRIDKAHLTAALDLLGLGTWGEVVAGKKAAPKKTRRRAGTAASARVEAEGGAE